MTTVVLDFDGPLLDGQLRHYNCYREIVVELGFPALDLQRYWRMKRARNNLRAILSASGAASIEQPFAAKWLERIEQPRLLAYDKLQPGVLGVLDDWAAKGARLVLVRPAMPGPLRRARPRRTMPGACTWA